MYSLVSLCFIIILSQPRGVFSQVFFRGVELVSDTDVKKKGGGASTSASASASADQEKPIEFLQELETIKREIAELKAAKVTQQTKIKSQQQQQQQQVMHEAQVVIADETQSSDQSVQNAQAQDVEFVDLISQNQKDALFGVEKFCVDDHWEGGKHIKKKAVWIKMTHDGLKNQWDEEYKRGQWGVLNDNPAERSRSAIIAGTLFQTYAKDGSFLDIGCGEGVMFDYLKPEQQQRYLGVDISKEGVEIGMKKRPSAKFEVSRAEVRVCYILCDTHTRTSHTHTHITNITHTHTHIHKYTHPTHKHTLQNKYSLHIGLQR